MERSHQDRKEVLIFGDLILLKISRRLIKQLFIDWNDFITGVDSEGILALLYIETK